MTREEAIKIAKNWVKTEQEKEVLEALVPELCESEDERIRKDIIAFIKAVVCKTAISGERECEWIAYLERQKEQKPAEWSEEDEKHINSIFNDLKQNVIPDEEDQEWLKNRFKSLRPQPKQEWGEEDIYITHILEYIVGKHRPDEIFKIGNKQGVSAYKICSWLNSLRSQPKQEWGKEDKKILNAIISVLKEINSQPLKRLEDWDGYIRFLESIRPQWKPSEEQMEALKHYVDTTTDGEIELLYNDLKKLM